MKRVVIICLFPFMCIAQDQAAATPVPAPAAALDFTVAQPAPTTQPEAIPMPQIPTQSDDAQSLINAINAFNQFQDALYKSYKDDIEKKKKLLTGSAYERRRPIIGELLSFIDKATKEVDSFGVIGQTGAIESAEFIALKQKKFQDLNPDDCATLKTYMKDSYNRMGALLDFIAGANQFLDEAKAIEILNAPIPQAPAA